MTRTPQQILETVASARAVAEQLRTRLSVERNVMDLGDLVHIQSTIKQIEEHLPMAAEDEEILRDRLKRTAARVPELGLSVASGARGVNLGGSREGLRLPQTLTLHYRTSCWTTSKVVGLRSEGPLGSMNMSIKAQTARQEVAREGLTAPTFGLQRVLS